MKCYFSIAVLLMLSSCTWMQKQPEPVCKLLFKAVSISSQAVATALQCENTAAIAADLSAQITKLGLCETTAQSSLSDFLCPQLSQMVSTLSVNALPVEWKCTGAIAGDIVKQKVSEACASIIK